MTVTVETADEIFSRTHTVKVGDPVAPPVASFTLTPTAPMIRQLANLAFDGSCDGDCSWSWDFGDGGHSDAANPSHAWEVPATYSVSLTVANEGGSDLVSVPVTVGSCWPPSPTPGGNTPRRPGSPHRSPGQCVVLEHRRYHEDRRNPRRAPIGSISMTVRVVGGTLLTTVVLNNCGDENGDASSTGPRTPRMYRRSSPSLPMATVTGRRRRRRRPHGAGRRCHRRLPNPGRRSPDHLHGTLRLIRSCRRFPRPSLFSTGEVNLWR